MSTNQSDATQLVGLNEGIYQDHEPLKVYSSRREVAQKRSESALVPNLGTLNQD